MKSLRRVIAVGVVAALASVAFAIQTPGAGADHTEPRLTLTIAPGEGLPGQNIHAIVPSEYREVCNVDNPVNLIIAELFTAIAGGMPATPEQLAAAVLAGAFEGEDLANLLQTVLFALAFVDPVTQDPVVDEITGEEAISFWSPVTGEGDILAPYVNPRPATYFVAAVCLGLRDEAAVAAAVAAAVERIEAFLVAFATGGGNIPTLLGCLSGDVSPCPIQSDLEAFEAEIEATITEFLTAVIDDDPDVAWVAPFCLLGDGLEACAVAEPAAPVAATPTFTG